MSQPNDYLADYRRLGLAEDCSLRELQQAWRRLVAEQHPDRAQSDAASAALVEMTQAYRRLRRFEQRYGRLPAQALPQSAKPAHRPLDVPAAPQTTAYSARPRNGMWGALGVMAALTLWWVEPEPESPTAPIQVGADAPPMPTRDAAAARAIKPRVIKLGDSAAHVRRVLGEPILRDGEVWEYGPSHIRFARQRVVAWYSSPLAPLPVEPELDATSGTR